MRDAPTSCANKALVCDTITLHTQEPLFIEEGSIYGE